MPRRKDRDAVDGPYAEQNGTWRVVVYRAGKRTAPTFQDEQEARDFVRGLKEEIEGRSQTTIREAVEQYIVDESMAEAHAQRTRRHLLGLFKQDQLLASLTPKQCQEGYDEYRKGRANDTHLNGLGQARTFLNWCVRRKLISSSPVVEVIGKGERKSGKDQLTIDEMLRLHAVCLREADKGDDAAVAVACALTFGIRATEVVSREARDLDAGGTVFRVRRLKKRNKVVIDNFRVPASLQPHLKRLAAQGGYLFPGRTYFWLRRNTKRLCRMAGVSIVSTQNLRGSVSSGMRTLGAPLEFIQQALSHEHVSITSRAYVSPQAETTAQHEARLEVFERVH